MIIEQEAAIFEAACDRNKATIDKLPDDSAEREAYVLGLSDGIEFALTAKT